MKKILKIVIIIMMSITTLLSQGQQVKAWDSSIPHEFSQVKSIDYPWWWSSKIGSVKQWSTTMCKYNGHIAYCLEASKNTPVNGDYVASVINNNSAVKKLLYYGYGGPGYDQKIEDMFEQQLEACVPDDFGKNHGNFEDGAYLFTHIWLSYAYCGDLMGLSLAEFNAKWPNPDGNGGYGDNIMWGYHVINAMPEPTYAQFNVNGQQSHRAQLTAVFDKENKVQKTETVTFAAGNNATTHITLQDQVTLHNVTSGTSQTGGTVTVYGGQSFYLTSPLTDGPDDYVSGNVAGEHCQRFEALAIIPGGNYQSEGSWIQDSASLYYEVNWMELGSLRLSKVDNTSAFQKGSQFRLVSTSYEGFDEIYEVSKDEDGDYELLIEGLPVGNYALTEIDCDDYFAPTIAQWTVTIEKNKTTKQIVVNTLRPTGNLSLHKTLEKAEVNITDVADDDITKTSYKIVASDNIKDTVSLKMLYQKNETVTIGSGKCIIDASGEKLEFSQGVTLVKGIANENGTFSVDKNGELQLSGIPLGKYKVIETSCPDGYVLDETEHDVKFIQQDYTTTVYSQSVKQTNKITKTLLSKTDITGEKEVEGASLKVTDQDGKIIDEWISSRHPHEIDGLTVGQTYTFHENLAPNGYNIANEIEFTVTNQEKQTIKMIDTIVTVEKVDENNQAIKGAKLEVVSPKTKNIIDRWTSGQHIIDIDDDMKTALLNHETVNGTVKDDNKEIIYSIQDNDGDYIVKMKDDTDVSYYTVDLNGNETAHMVQGLTVGEEYILREVETPKGYATAKEQKFTAKANENVNVTMVDEMTKTVFHKQDRVSKQELSGAKLEVKDEKGKVIDTWISDSKPHEILGLEAGKTYTMIELTAPQGYQQAESVTFTVEDTGNRQHVYMYDERSIVMTGDTNEIIGYLFMTVSTFVMIFGLIYFRIRNHN